MAHMPNFAAELGDVEHAAERFGDGVIRLLHHDPRAPRDHPYPPVTETPAPEPEPMAAAPAEAEPAAEPVTTVEEPMSLSDQLAPLTTLAGRLDALGGDDAIAKLETVKANPDGSRAFDAVAALSARGQLSAAAVAMVSALVALAAQPQ